MIQIKENRVLPLRDGPMTTAAYVALRLQQMAPPFVATLLGGDAALVPVPRSSLQRPGALWPAREIADALHARGFGSRVLPCLQRSTAVPKAATSAARERPKARVHRDSLVVLEPLALPATVTLVDDVITRGAQLLGAAWAIWAARPDVNVRAFAVMRTISDAADFTAIAAPCEGIVSVRGDETFRSP